MKNTRKYFGLFALAILQFAVSQSLPAQEKDKKKNKDDDKPRVLLLGDSISIGYTKHVQSALKDEAVVLRPLNKNKKGFENCAGTKKGVGAIDRWLKIEGGKWDIIHFNFGLHDLKHVDAKTGKNSNKKSDPHQSDPETYKKQLEEIVKKLKATGAKLIFATTTPVPEGGVRPYRDPKDVKKYNEIASKIMKENGIAINDLYAFAEPQLSKIQQKVNVHFTKQGSKALSIQVVEALKTAMKQKEKKAK